MFHACTVRFDVMENLIKFWVFSLNRWSAWRVRQVAGRTGGRQHVKAVGACGHVTATWPPFPFLATPYVRAPCACACAAALHSTGRIVRAGLRIRCSCVLRTSIESGSCVVYTVIANIKATRPWSSPCTPYRIELNLPFRPGETLWPRRRHDTAHTRPGPRRPPRGDDGADPVPKRRAPCRIGCMGGPAPISRKIRGGIRWVTTACHCEYAGAVHGAGRRLGYNGVHCEYAGAARLVRVG